MVVDTLATSSRVCKIVQTKEVIKNAITQSVKQVAKRAEKESEQMAGADPGTKKVISTSTRSAAPALVSASVVMNTIKYNICLKRYKKFMGAHGKEIHKAVFAQGILTKKDAFEVGESHMTKIVDFSNYGTKGAIITENLNNEMANVVQIAKSYKATYGLTNKLGYQKDIIKETVKENHRRKQTAKSKARGKPDGSPGNGKTGKSNSNKTGSDKGKPQKRPKYTKANREEIKELLHKANNDLAIPDKAQKKLVNKMGKKAKHLEKYGKKMRVKNIGKSGAKSIKSLITKPLNNSEVMQGYRILDAAKVPVKIAWKSGTKLVGRFSFHALKAIRVHKEVKALQVLDKAKAMKRGTPLQVSSKKELRREAKKIIERKMGKKYSKNYFTNKAKDNGLKAIQNLTANSRFSHVQEIHNQVKVTRDLGHANKATAKEARKGIRKGFRADRHKAKVKKKIAKKTAKAATKGITKKAETTATKVSSKALTKIGQNAFKAAQKATKAVTDAIAALIKAIAGAVSLGLPAVIIFIAIVLLMIVGFAISQDAIAQNAMAVWFDAGEPSTSSFDSAMEDLQSKHSSLATKIEDLEANYEVADVQYTNGSKENYKEILSATSVMFNEQPYDFDNADIEKAISDLYDQTHMVTVEEYNFLENDGTSQKAAHIFVNIQRNEELCYAALYGITSSGGSGGAGGNYCPAGSVANDDWMNIVKTMKSLIASTGTAYDSTKYLPITVNDKTYSVRADCSGYVSACLQVYGASTETWSSFQFTDAGSIPGFTKYSWSGWDNLQAGDIIATNGHVEIFSNNENGRHYVYSNGTTECCRSPGVSTDNRSYITVWRPNSPGSVNGSTSASDSTSGTPAKPVTVSQEEAHLLACIIDCEAEGEPYQGQLAVGSVIMNRAASPNYPNTITGVVYQKGQFAPVAQGRLAKMLQKGPTNNCLKAAQEVLSGVRAVNYLNFRVNDGSVQGQVIGNHVFHGKTIDVAVSGGTSGSTGTGEIMFSNMDGIELNDKGNQDGYETALKATVNATKSLSKFSSSHYDDSNRTNYDISDTASSLDYIRYVFAKHGVSINYTMYDMIKNFTSTSIKKAEVGDIVIYQPKTKDAESITALTKEYNKADSDDEKQAVYDKYDNLIPMVYIGNDQVAVYSKDLTKSDLGGRYNYSNSSAQVRIYNVSDLDAKRIVDTRHVTGFLNKSIYGSTEFFSGWTDDNIAVMIEILNQNYWNTKKVEFKDSEGNITTTDFFASYKEDSFDGSSVEGNSVFSTDNHDDTFFNDLARIALMSYEDYVILPSVLTSDAVVKSNNRTTEESLKYFNIYEKLATAGGVSVDKYTYDSDGNPSVEPKSYVQYGSLKEALNDHCVDLNSKYSLGSATSYKKLTSMLSSGGYCSSSDASKMNSIIRSSDLLQNYDTIAVTRKKYMDETIAATSKLNNLINVYGSSTTATGYNKLKDAKTDLEKKNKTFSEYVVSTDTASTKSDKAISDAYSAIDTATKKMAAQVTAQVSKVTKETTRLTNTTNGYKNKSLTSKEFAALQKSITKAEKVRDTFKQYVKDTGCGDDTTNSAISNIKDAIDEANNLIDSQITVQVNVVNEANKSLKNAIDSHGSTTNFTKDDYDALKAEIKSAQSARDALNASIGFFDFRSKAAIVAIDKTLKKAKSISDAQYKHHEDNKEVKGYYCRGVYWSRTHTLYHSAKYPRGHVFANTDSAINFLGKKESNIKYCHDYETVYTDGW